jgi:hypothetical protein
MTRLCRPAASGLFDDRRQRVAASVSAPGTTVPDELVIPSDLSPMETADVQALHDQAVSAFNEIYGDGTAELSDSEYQTLAAVTESVERLRAELETRSAQSAERQAGLAELAGRVNVSTGEPDPAEGETDPAEAPAEAEGEGEAGEGDGFSSRRVSLASLRNRRSRQAPAPRSATAPGMRDYVTAAADLPGFSNGQGMDWHDIGRAVDARLRGFNQAQYESARRAGRAMRQQFGVAIVRRPTPPDLMIQSNDPAHVDEVIRRATDQSRLPGGSLLAAGGWCAPSEILYDLLELESDDGLISVPEIGVARGGIQWTTGPDYSDIYLNTGFKFSELQDEAGSYSGGTNQKQTITITGTPTGGTFTLTMPADDNFNLPATTSAIPYNATSAQVVAALQAVLPTGTITATGGALPGTPVVVTFGGVLGQLSLPLMTATSGALTGGSSPTVTPTITTAGVVGTDGKPCYAVPCPVFQERRLDLMGICISAGLLAQRGYPEVLARTIRGALIGHEHRMAASVISEMVNGSTVVSYTGGTGQTAPLLTAIEQQVDHYRYAHRMPRTTTYEAIFPFWVRGVIRTDLSHRLYVDYLSVTDAMIDGWFAQRGIAAQFVYNWQDITGTADTFTSWASTVTFLLYAAGTWVKGTSDIISLDTIYDSVNLAQNDYTALFTEEGYLMAKRGFDSRVISVQMGTAGA